MSSSGEKRVCRAVAWMPNCVTSLGLVCGFAAIVLSGDLMSDGMSGVARLELCWMLVGAAAVFDFLDGMVARMLHATSAIGKELDSLCDLVSFGITPAVMLHNTIKWFRPEWPCWVTWLPAVIAVCGALRLAKFNVDPRQTSSFIGLPIPANAIFWIGFTAMLARGGLYSELTAAAVVVVVSLLMVSELPMFSFKFKSPFRMDLLNVCRAVMIISAVLLVILLGVEGLMWAIVAYVSLSAANALASGSRC